MSNRKNPDTSNEALRSLKLEDLNEIYRLIIGALNVLGKGTFEDIAAYLKKDSSKIWKRMSELERMMVVYRPGTKKLLKSGRNGYEWMLTNSSTQKTETEHKYVKGEKTAVDHANELIRQAQNHGAFQPELFPNYQKALKNERLPVHPPA